MFSFLKGFLKGAIKSNYNYTSVTKINEVTVKKTNGKKVITVNGKKLKEGTPEYNRVNTKVELGEKKLKENMDVLEKRLETMGKDMEEVFKDLP